MGRIPALLLLPCVLVMFVVGLLGYDMIRGMWGYQHNKKLYSPAVNAVERLATEWVGGAVVTARLLARPA